MKKTHRYLGKLRIILTLCLCVALATCTISPALAQQQGHMPLTQQLIDMVEHNATLKTILIQSIAQAKEVNPDRQTNPAQSLEEYYDFIDWSAQCMPWSIVKGLPYPSIFEKIDQSLDYFYFLLDQPLNELADAGLYYNSVQYVEPFRSWLIAYAKTWGAYLSTEDSWSEEYYQAALAEPRFGLENGWYEDASNWNSFNDFFSRQLSSPDARPISSPTDDQVVIAPADSVPQGVWVIDGESNIVQKEGVLLKSKVFNSVNELLGPTTAYADAFAGGTLTHTFLNVDDYHRYHFPVSGTVVEVRLIEQDDAAGGITIWNNDLQRYVLLDETPGWQSIETRGCVIVDTHAYGLVAILPIGMSQVSSVNFEPNVQVGAEVTKGDPLGYFLFGGSDIVMLFQKDVAFKLTVSPYQEDDGYSHVLMGEAYGTMTHAE